MPDIQIVSRIFAPEPAAASFRLAALTKALHAHGVTVDVLTTIPAPGHDRQAHCDMDDLSGVRIRRVQAKRDKTGYIRGYLSYLSFDIPAFFRLLFMPAPRVYVVEPPPTTGLVVRVLSWLRRRPYVFYAADIWSDAAAAMAVPAVVVQALRGVESWVLRGAAVVLTPTEDGACRVRALGARHVVVVPNGIDTEVFTDQGAVPEPLAGANPGDGDWLVYAGTASEWQGAEVFLEAFDQVRQDFPQARLLFLGQGSAWPALQARAARLPRGLVFFAQTDPASAAAWQRQAAAALVSLKPDTGYDSAYPTKVYAALACGTPVLFAGVGPAARDIATHRLGLALPWRVDAVVRGMRRVLSGNLDTADLRAWALRHCSLGATGDKAARVVMKAANISGQTPGKGQSGKV